MKLLIATILFAGMNALVPNRPRSTTVGSQQTALLLASTATLDDDATLIKQATTLDGRAKETIISADMMDAIEVEAEQAVQEMMDEECQVDFETGMPKDELCADEIKKEGFRNALKNYVRGTIHYLRGNSNTNDNDDANNDPALEGSSPGEVLERGWEERANSSAIRRNAEVWKVALNCVFKTLKPKKLRAKGASDEEILAAQQHAADYICESALKLGPSFVKLGQVASTRTDVLPKVYTDALRKLTDDVPGFSGKRAKQIIEAELGRPCDEIFQNFSPEPLKAASLGQVHAALYKGQKVAIKVQRAGLKELFDIDLKNLKKLASLLDKFDPKTDGADRDWVSIYEESERLLYLEIDYLHEASNTDRFAKDFKDVDYVRIPKVIREVTTPKILTMEFVESFKLTDIDKIERLGLDRVQLSERVANSFLRQIIETGYFHADPHSGNLCVNEKGDLVFYDYGLMDELKPNVRKGFRQFCTALFAGGPQVSDITLAKNAKELVKGVELAGVLDKNADRLAVEKLARFFMRTFKDKQLGKSGKNIKETIGTDLQTLTENNVFRFPSTFTFIFRAFASVDGIGKELNKDFDIGKLAQPFIEKFTDSQSGYDSAAEKNFAIFKKATGLNRDDVGKALTQPRKVAYIEETLRSMEEGSLKIRVRSLENEKALERQSLRQTLMENVLFASLLFNVANLASKTLIRNASIAGASFFLFQSLMANVKIKKFDKTQAKYVGTGFVEEGDEVEK